MAECVLSGEVTMQRTVTRRREAIIRATPDPTPASVQA